MTYRYGVAQARRFASWGSSAIVQRPSADATSAAAVPAHSPAATPCRVRASANGSRLPRADVRRAATIPATTVAPITASIASTRAASYPQASHTFARCSGWPIGGSADRTRPPTTPALMPTLRAAGPAGDRRAVTARSPATQTASSPRKTTSPVQTPTSKCR
jgi:hypothetical protein